MPETKLRWLHLSDLHAGMHSQAWLWPTFKHAFYDDLDLLASRHGPWDVVVFSGDLTQRASSDDFDQLTNNLVELWERLGQLGPRPVLFPIPGNHDVIRPNPKEPAVVLLEQWQQNEAVREDFWDGSTPAYREKIEEAFSSFVEWRTGLSAHGISVPDFTTGLIPGDASTVIEKSGLRLGLAGLNSAWLQLGEGDYRGRLEVDPRQLMAITGNDPIAWCRNNLANFIITHHPCDWLGEHARAAWDSEVNPAGRFTAHLFGHMHEQATQSASESGGPFRNSIQAASLFGLERFRGNVRRIHGYSVGEICHESPRPRLWPRRLRALGNGSWKLGPDFTFSLDEDNSMLLPDTIQAETEISSYRVAPTSALANPQTQRASAVLEKLAYPIPHADAHRNVRRIEQKTSLSALQETRTTWLAAEWGMGAEGFLWSVKAAAGDGGLRVYRIALRDFSTREQFLSGIEETLNCSFQALCDAIADKGPSYVLLDEAPVGREVQGSNALSEQELESVIRVMLDYCPEVRVIVRSRRLPIGLSLPVTELKPLDEADLRSYVEDSDRAKDHVTHPSLISELFRLTDGVPSRVDAALGELQVVAVTELVSSNPDFEQQPALLVDTPVALVQAVSEISESEDPTLKRAYALLKALSAFPQGEQLHRIRRFLGVHPFFKGHAQELISRSLLKSLAPQQNIAGDPSGSANILVVSRPVREYVRSLLNQAEVTSIDRKALSLYFGEKWTSGEIHTQSGLRFDDPKRTNYEIVNAATIIVRFLRTAVSNNNERSIDGAIRIGSSFIKALESGDHYRNAVTLCRDLLAAIPVEGYRRQRATVEFQLAGNLRMAGETAQARDMILGLKLEELSRDKRLEALLELALSHNSLGETELALDAARSIKKLDRVSPQALQADSIIIEATADETTKAEKLKRLETLARRRKVFVIANNVALTRAMLPGTPSLEAESILKAVLKNARTSGDFYNGMRAVIFVAQHALNRGETVPEGTKIQLITAYHYLFQERGKLFDSCHRVLWRIFQHALEAENLLRLFRTSSFIWRLRGDERKEQEWVTELAGILRASGNRSFRRVDRELTYYVVRSNVVEPSTD